MKCPVTGLKVKGAGVGDKSERCLSLLSHWSCQH